MLDVVKKETKRSIEVCMSPLMYSIHKDSNKTVVVIDVFRATSSIITAIANGVKEIICIGSKEEAFAFKQAGGTLAGERDSVKLEFADFGNSPAEFSESVVKGKTIGYSTTNGTKVFRLVEDCTRVYAGAFLNLTAITKRLVEDDRDVLLFCAGWKGRFCIEDTLFAGALAANLLRSGNFETLCDTTNTSVNMWLPVEKEALLKGGLEKVLAPIAGSRRLKSHGLESAVKDCSQIDTLTSIPILKENGRLVLS